MPRFFKRRNPVLRDVEAAFSSLIKQGRLRVVDDSYSWTSFGNGIVVLEGSVVRVRVVQDRGTIDVEVGSQVEPGRWYLLRRAVRACTGRQDLADTSLGLEQAASFLEQHFDTLEENFTADRWLRTRAACDSIDDSVRQAWVEKFRKNER